MIEFTDRLIELAKVADWQLSEDKQLEAMIAGEMLSFTADGRMLYGPLRCGRGDRVYDEVRALAERAWAKNKLLEMNSE